MPLSTRRSQPGFSQSDFCRAILQHCVGVVFEAKELLSEVLIVSLRATDVLGMEDVIPHLPH